MLYTEDFTMRHYVGFSQIGSHLFKSPSIYLLRISLFYLLLVYCVFRNATRDCKLLDAKGVALNIPPSLDQSGQLSEYERVKTHRISLVRLHVERTIAIIKNYHILESIPNSMHNIANHIFYVCSIFTNVHPTLVEYH